MSLRRSARLQAQDDPAPVPTPQDAAEPAKNRKRKATATTGTQKRKSTELALRTQPASNSDKLSDLPAEILDLILDNVTDPSAMGKLSRTCKTYYSIMAPRLHKRVAVAAMFHAHIFKVIRALEPHLTIAQKKQLKKEGQYKGQQAKYPTGLNQHAIPECASWVRQIVIGRIDPGKNHEYIVHRYVEEAFQNMDNLEIVETKSLTVSMARHLLTLKNLHALSMSLGGPELEAMTLLHNIKNLKHLVIDIASDDSVAIEELIWELLLNSKDTLETLMIETDFWNWIMPEQWRQNASTGDDAKDQPPYLTALKSLTISCNSYDSGFVETLGRTFNFLELQELVLGSSTYGQESLVDYLANLLSTTTTTNLRSLTLDMSNIGWLMTLEKDRENLETWCRLISSFDSLISLNLKDYTKHIDEYDEDSKPSNMVLQAILKHKNLKSLKMSYAGVSSHRMTPFLSAANVAEIINNLPHLKEFHFSPDESEMVEIGRALARRPSLVSISLFPFASWGKFCPPEDPECDVLRNMLKGYLAHSDKSYGYAMYWEHEYRLKRVTLADRVWEIASRFGKPRKGMKKKERIVSDDAKREVMLREITGTMPYAVHVGYNPQFPWTERVAGYTGKVIEIPTW